MSQDPARHQRRYWNELVQLKVQQYYFGLYQQSSEQADTRLKIFLAVTSSGSIAGWAVWTQFQFVWALVIASSQLLNAVKHLLPYIDLREAEGAATATIQKEMAALKRMFRLALQNETLSHMPYVPVPKPRNTRTNFLDGEDLERVIEALPHT